MLRAGPAIGPGSSGRKALLLGTALASTLLIATVVAPSPAQAQTVDCTGFTTPGQPIVLNGGGGGETDPIDCDNALPRAGNLASNFRAIDLLTNAPGTTIDLYNAGRLQALADPLLAAAGIYAETFAASSGIRITNNGDIDKIETDSDRAIGIFARTQDSAGTNNDIWITNRGKIQVETNDGLANAYGIYGRTYAADSPVTIRNYGDIGLLTDSSGSLSGSSADLFDVKTYDRNSKIEIVSHGDLSVETRGEESSADVFQADTYGSNSSIRFENTGDISVLTKGRESGAEVFDAYTYAAGNRIDIVNHGDLSVETRGYGSTVDVFDAFTDNENSTIRFENTGDIKVLTEGNFDPSDPYSKVEVFDASVFDENSRIEIVNHGDIDVETRGDNSTVKVFDPDARGANGEIKIVNHGDIQVETKGDYSYVEVLQAEGHEPGAQIEIHNSGDVRVKTTGSFSDVQGFYVATVRPNSPIDIVNRGNIHIETTGNYSIASGLLIGTVGPNSRIDIVNSGNIDVASKTLFARGIVANTYSDNSPIAITNSGDITARVANDGYDAFGVYASTYSDNSLIAITNSGDITARVANDGYDALGVYASVFGKNSQIAIDNSGSIFADGKYSQGIYAYSLNNNLTKITNTGEIGASSHFAIDVDGAGAANIYNAGTITGYVNLTDQNDLFVNRSGGVFETKRTSFFGGGNDLFLNEAGGTVQAATDRRTRETSGFQGLETFKNSGGTISLVDGGVGDVFTIANAPGAANLTFDGGGFLAVDAGLRGPGSRADSFIVDGNVSGRTKVIVNNTSTLPGAFNNEGIPIVFVDGNTPREGNFVLANGPIDTGFFDYDLFFVPTGSGQWELRSFAGGTAQALPKLLTAAQDLWHESASTWFDRTADLRVILNGGFAAGGALGAGPAYDGSTKSLREPGPNGLTPGVLTPSVWIKGGGGQLDRDASAKTSAYGRTYTYDLDNALTTFDLQVGVDMGRYDVIAQGDVLVFGVLGGFIGANLDYGSNLADTFGFSGGQVGAYATYLNGGLFVDTLLNVHLYEIDTPNLGFPDSLDGSTVGLRTDAGYRFGSFTGGVFFEPLATIEVMWADIDGFNLAGNAVSFSDDANVRGRIGGRVGATMQAWEGTMMEPFVIASLWGNLSDDNSARLVSSGTTFTFQNDLQDVWGEVSAGVNLFNVTQTTSVFAKVDYTFGEDISGVGGKGGVRVAW